MTIESTQPAAAEDEVERVALVILNSDRLAAGWPAVTSRDNIPDSDGYVRNARDVIAAMRPEGMVLVPREPTEAMLKAVGWPFMGYMFPTQVDSAVRRMWSAMLAACAKQGGE